MNYQVGLYIRLSKEDFDKKDHAESESIQNQRTLLENYVKKKNLNIYDEYIDDGFSGTNFDRPSFQRLLKDIEKKRVNMVITKDLSRLGRDYIHTGYLLEQYFPLNKVRYVSILDQIDTESDTSNNDIAPFKSLFNDMQSKDTSKKIRSILQTKKKQGLFLGSSSSYGYQKDPFNKHKLIIDPKTAPIVKKIFLLTYQGKSKQQICNFLNKENIPTPTNYKHPEKQIKQWTPNCLYPILRNPIYLGHMVQGRQAKLNYKSKKRILLSKEQWIVVPNTHEPIIPSKVFETIHSRKKEKRKESLSSILDSLLFCDDCQSPMKLLKDDRNKKNPHYNLNCSSYLSHLQKQTCTSHFISYTLMESTIKEKISHYLHSTTPKKIYSLLKKEKEKEIDVQKKFLLERKQKEENILLNLYQDQIDHTIDPIIYKNLKQKTNEKLKEIEKDIFTFDQKTYDFSSIEKIVQNFWKQPFTNDFLCFIIEKILITKNKDIKIYYRFSSHQRLK